jgi:WD40 repeat protein
MRFLLGGVERAATEIQQSLDLQDAKLRVLIDQNGRQLTEARLTRETVAVIERRIRAGTGDETAAGADRRPRWLQGCPYRGLLPFDETHAEVYYGRERLTAELVGKLAGRLTGTGMIIVTGASGAGKSSLLRAGLLPALARGLQLPGSERWPRMLITPTRNPLTELATHLAVLGGADAAAVRDRLVSDPGQAHLIVRQAVVAAAARQAGGSRVSGGGDARLVLIVDQFEQVFTLNPGEGGDAERQAFITALYSAASRPAGPSSGPPALVVIAVRGDFWDRCAAHRELAAALQQGQFVVAPMTPTDLRLAITGPADAAGLQIDAALTDAIMNDLRSAGSQDTTGILPLLSQAMALTRENREDGRLTSRGYDLAGGVSHAVQASADAVYDTLPGEQQTLAREVLRNMTVVGREGRLTRRPVIRADLYAAHLGAGRPQVDAVLEAFADKRLLILNDGTAQIAHDALLQAWPRLRSWLDDDQASWILRSQLTEDADAWRDNRDDPSFLYRGTQLAALRQATAGWRANPARYPALTSTQRDFLASSERAAARGSRQRRMLAAALVLLLIASVAGAGIAISAARNANQQRKLAVSGQLTAQSEALDTTDPVTASRLAAAAWHFDPTAQARVGILDALAQPQRGVLTAGTSAATAVAFSPDGTTLATASFAGTVRLWDVATRRQIGAAMSAGTSAGYRTFPLNLVATMTFSPDGKILATASFGGTVRLWDVATQRETWALVRPGFSGPVAVAFSSDGKVLATASHGTVRLWDVATRQQLSHLSLGDTRGFETAMAFSPNGKILVTAGTRGARMWNVATGQQVGKPMNSENHHLSGINRIDDVAFSPDGTTLVTASSGGGAVFWTVPAGQQIGKALPGPGGMFQYAAFSPDGKVLATTDQTGTVTLWNVATRQQVGAPLTASNSPVDAIAFSPRREILATADADGTARLWDVAIWRQIGSSSAVTGRGGFVSAVAFRRDGIILATAASDGALRLWDVASQRPIGALVPGRAGGVTTSVAFSPDGKVVAAAVGGTIRLWQLATRRAMSPPLQIGTRNQVDAMTFSPDGQTLATPIGGTVRLWDAATGRRIGTLLSPRPGFSKSVNALAFSADGSTIAAASLQTARLWNVATHRQISAFRIGPPATTENESFKTVNSVAFSPGGRILAAAIGGAVRLWDMTTGQQIGPPLTPGTNARFVDALAFNPDGKTLATAVHGGSVILWDLAARQHIGVPLSVATSRFAAVNLLVFSPDGKTLATEGGDPSTAAGGATLRLWDVALPGDLVSAVCSIASHSLTRQEWKTYIQSEPFQQVCP